MGADRVAPEMLRAIQADEPGFLVNFLEQDLAEHRQPAMRFEPPLPVFREALSIPDMIPTISVVSSAALITVMLFMLV